ncbi:hypothetical protein LTR95_005085 [Oleoguttula sp. CCFEE 5521]
MKMPTMQSSARTSKAPAHKRKRPKMDDDEETVQPALVQEPESPRGIVFISIAEQEEANPALIQARRALKEAQRAQKEAESSYQASRRNPGASNALASFRSGRLRSTTVSAPLPASSPLLAFTSGRFRDATASAERAFTTSAFESSSNDTSASSPASSVGLGNAPASSRTSPETMDEEEAEPSSTSGRRQSKRQVKRISYVFPPLDAEDELASGASEVDRFVPKRLRRNREEEDADFQMEDVDEAAEEVEVEEDEDEDEDEEYPEAADEEEEDESDVIDNKTTNAGKPKRGKPKSAASAAKGPGNQPVGKASTQMIKYNTRKPWYCLNNRTFYAAGLKKTIDVQQQRERAAWEQASVDGDKKRYQQCKALVEDHLQFEPRNNGKGLNLSLPPIHEIDEMFLDMVGKAQGLGLTDALQILHRPLRVATMCSGTESPLLAMEMIAEALKTSGIDFKFDHLFSAEITAFKQAYVQRNFNPALIFRDVGELITAMQSHPPMATTAYGALMRVPEDVDILIAGTSCKDFSNLNNWQKGLVSEGGGESSKTWFGVLSYVQVTRPKIVILENVAGAPFDQMLNCYRRLGYDVSGVIVDTKDYYLPQTRQRGYVVAFYRGQEGAAYEWAIMMGHMQRQASSSVAEFLLPSDELRSRPHESIEVDAKGRKEVDWAVCQLRHMETRAEERLGSGRSVLNWSESGAIDVPEHGFDPYYQTMVNRRRDYIEIAVRRRATEEDVRFKQNLWNISQNVHMTSGRTPYGIVGCITPTGSLYASDAARALTAEELLKLQGIPLNKVSFTNETQAEIQDLAGNAMTSTVVGAAILCAMTHGMPAIIAQDTSRHLESSGLASQEHLFTPIRPSTAEIASVDVSNVPCSVSTSDASVNLQSWCAEASRSVRRCYCEGAQDLTTAAIQQCVDCSHTTCVKCGGNPPHSYSVAEDLTSNRSSPLLFEKKLRSELPLHLALDSERVRSLLEDVKHGISNTDYFTAVSEALQSDFHFEGVVRKRDWIVNYTASCARLLLYLNGDLAEWRLYAVPSASLSADSALRELLKLPVARCSLSAMSWFKGQWQWRDLPEKSVSICVRAKGKSIPSWLAKLQLPDEEHSEAPSQLQITAPDALVTLSGTYKALPKCGTAYDSLYKKCDTYGDGQPIYLFQDPTRTGKHEDDAFVFAHDHERLDYGENRITIAHLGRTWKPWSAEKKSSDQKSFQQPKLTLDAVWRVTDQILAPMQMPANVSLPLVRSFARAQLQCQKAQLIVSCEVPNTTELVPSASPISMSNTSFLAEHSWAFEFMRRHLPRDDWQSLSSGIVADCKTCAPPRPQLRWTLNEKGALVANEDMRACTDYERKIKQQHAPLVIDMIVTKLSKTFRFGIDLASMAHKAAAHLSAPATQLAWRLQSVADAAEYRFQPFTLSATIGTPFDGQTGMIKADDRTLQDLMPRQKVQLAWLRRQEAGPGAAFDIEATQEARFAGWRAEVRAKTTVHVRGSISADHPGFGKTLTSLALIHLQDDAALMQDLKLRQVLCTKAAGLLPVKATLIVSPNVLTEQWVLEAASKFGYTSGDDVLHIKNIAALEKLTIDHFKEAKIIVINRDTLLNEPYAARLAEFVAMPGPAAKSGRAYSKWHALARSYVHEHLEALAENGIAGLREFNKKVRTERSEEFWDSASNAKTSAKTFASKQIVPLFEMFWFNRIIIDEFHDCGPQMLDMLRAIQADKRHLLSGTPKLNDTYQVAQMAALLGVSLAHGSNSSKAMTQESLRAVKRDATDMERFEANQQVVSDHMHIRLHTRAQAFLDTFARQNIMDGQPLPIEEHLLPVKLDCDHMVLYKEISQRLMSQEMVLRAGKDTRRTGQDERFTKALADRSHAEEVLSRRATTLDREEELPKRLNGLVTDCEAEVNEIKALLNNACRQAQTSHNLALERFAEQKLLAGPLGLGDLETINIIKHAIASTKGNRAREQWLVEQQKSTFVAAAGNAEDSEDDEGEDGAQKQKPRAPAARKGSRETKLKEGKSTAIERTTAVEITIIAEELLTAVRARRFMKNAARLLKQPACEVPKCKGKIDNAAVSALCGHAICEQCNTLLQSNPDAQCPHAGCESPMRDQHLLWSHTLANIKQKTSYGAKIEGAIEVLEKIRDKHQRAILFVQYDSQLADVELALQTAGIDATIVDDSADAGNAIKTFASKKSTDTVIVLDASSENAAGSNLQCANHVIFLSPLLRDTQYTYDSKMAQAIGRVKRHGQKNKIYVHRLVALYTIDVDILEAREYRNEKASKQALTQQGAPAIAAPSSAVLQSSGKRPAVNAKAAKLVKEAGKYSLRPYSWVSGQRGGAELEAQDLSSQITFSKAFQE